jgi:hypothetical protein
MVMRLEKEPHRSGAEESSLKTQARGTHQPGRRSQLKESEVWLAFPIQQYHKLSGRVSTFQQCNTYILFTAPVDRNYI